MTSCSKDDDDDNKKQNLGQSNSTSAEAFYNGLTNNKDVTILVDMRTAALYDAGHIKGAINIDCESTDDAYFDENNVLYKTLEELDPQHEKFIQIYDSKGASQFTIKVASIIAKKGWGAKKVFTLMTSYDEFAKKFPDVIEK